MGIWDEIRRTFREGSNLIKLIYVNIAVFILMTITAIIGFLLKDPSIPDKALNLVAMPSLITSFLVKPWTIITYMFVHQDIWHILFNMMWLYWFGGIFLEYLDQKKIVAVYILGGITGALVYSVSFNIFPAFAEVVHTSVAIGASASVMAVVIAIAAYVPNYTIQLLLIGRIKIKYVALAIFLLTSIMDFSVNSGGKLAHIGGAFFGYFYTLSLRKGHDMGKGIDKITGFLTALFKPRKKIKVTHRRTGNDIEYNKTKAEHQTKINTILDKISKGGYDSLTHEEKEILFRESHKNQ